MDQALDKSQGVLLKKAWRPKVTINFLHQSSYFR